MPEASLPTLLDRFVRRMHVSLRDKAPDFDSEKVGPIGGMILLTMAELGRVPMQELTARFGRDKSQMTRAMQSLERKGLVERAKSKEDMRVTLVGLTPRGEAFVAVLRNVIEESINEILEPISDQEREVLTSILSRVSL